MKPKKKVIHLIPVDATGGVELGVKIAQKELKNKINYKAKFIYNLKDNLLIRLIKCLIVIYKLYVLSKKEEKIIIISSLWMPHLSAFILKTLTKNFFWISFLHSSKYPSLFNELICTKLTKFSDDKIFDSLSTSKSYFKKNYKNSKIVNYFFKSVKYPKFKIKNWNKREYDFIIVARNIKSKGFFELEQFIQNWMLKYKSKPKVLIITNNIKKKFNLSKLKNTFYKSCDINFKTNISNKKVLEYLSKSKIYICLSHHEGFGITILESLLSGCFVITTNVGEQQKYLYPNRRLILDNKARYKLDFNYINRIGPSEANFMQAKFFLHKNVKPYSESLRRIVMENN